MKVSFVINEDYLIAHTLYSMNRYSSDQGTEEIVAFQSKAWSISQKAYNFLVNRHFPEGTLDVPLDQLVEVAKEAQELVTVLKNTPEYKAILQQTEEYKAQIEQEWSSNFESSLKFMQQMTGLPFDGEYTVFLTYPSLRNGKYLGRRRIAWGYSSEVKNYSTVYLWHEALHDDANLGTDGVIGHTLIELLADNELRVHLNSCSPKPLVGHDTLNKIRKRIYNSDWKAYIASPKRDILDFKKKVEQKYQV